MRISEVICEDEDVESDSEQKILTVLSFLDQKNVKDIPTPDFLTLVNHAGANIDYQGLQTLNNSSQKLKNVITSIDNSHIVIKGEDPEQTTDNTAQSKDPTKVVNSMAKKALDNRS
jgi:hypothetical protein